MEKLISASSILGADGVGLSASQVGYLMFRVKGLKVLIFYLISVVEWKVSFALPHNQTWRFKHMNK